MSSPAELRASFRSVTRDHRLTLQEWRKQLRPKLGPATGHASPVDDELIRLLPTARHVRVKVQREVAERMRKDGYPLRDDKFVVVAATLAGNVTREDVVFDFLAQKLGRQHDQLRIAVIDDSRFDARHPALRAKLTRVPAPADKSLAKLLRLQASRPEGEVGHGDAVASLAAAGTDQLKVVALPWDGDGVRDSRIIDHAIRRGRAKVVNLSFSEQNAAQATQLANTMRRHRDVLFVVSAGNLGRDVDAAQRNSRRKHLPEGVVAVVQRGAFSTTVQYRSGIGLPNVVHVASAYGGSLTPYSNFGKQTVDLAVDQGPVMEGTLAASTGGYALHRGTSFTAPQATNIAAKCLVLDPTLKPRQLIQILTIASQPRTRVERVTGIKSGGELNKDRALKLAAVHALVGRGRSPKAAAAELGLGKLVLEDYAQLAALPRLSH
jgi:subtilisin family serine protease